MTLGFPINPAGAAHESINNYWAIFLEYIYVLGNGHTTVNKAAKPFSFKDLCWSGKDRTHM